MKHDATHYAILAAVWLATVVAAIVLWRQAAELPSAMPLDELQRTLNTLRSDALEARMLALQLAEGRLTVNFAKEQHRKLRDDLEDVRKALDKPPARGHEADVSKALAAVDRLDTLVKAVPAAMIDAAALRRLADEDAAVARELPATPP